MKLKISLAISALAAFSGGIVFQSSAMETPSSKGASQNTSDSWVWIRNESEWPAQINYTLNGKEVVLRLEPGRFVRLGKAGSLKNITYYNYGYLYEKVAKEWPLEFTTKLKEGSDLVLILTTWFGVWSDKGVEYLAPGEAPREKKSPLEEPGKELTRWDYFPEAKKSIEYYPNDRERAYRIVMGLKPGFTKTDLTEARRRLALFYHPDKEGAEEAMKLVNEAYDTLKDKAS